MHKHYVPCHTKPTRVFVKIILSVTVSELNLCFAFNCCVLSHGLKMYKNVSDSDK